MTKSMKDMETITVSKTQIQIPLIQEKTGQRITTEEGELAVQSNDYPTMYKIILEKDEDGRVVVTCPELKGVVTDGKDTNEAIKNAYESIQAMLGSLGKSAEHFNLIYDEIEV